MIEFIDSIMVWGLQTGSLFFLLLLIFRFFVKEPLKYLKRK